jgi:hypothetical protein
VPPIHNPLPQNWAALHFFGARALGQEAIFLRVSAQMSRKWGTTAELLSVKIAAKTAWNGDSSFPKLGIVGTGFSVGRYFLFDLAPDLREVLSGRGWRPKRRHQIRRHQPQCATVSRVNAEDAQNSALKIQGDRPRT